MNEKINSFSKEAIKVRMLQNAVKIWGLKSVSSVDPFVSLLIDAFATEISKAGSEIQAVNSRILEKLAKLLTPSIYTYPQPAHAIAYIQANDMEEVMPAYSEFFTKKQVLSSAKSVSDIQVDIHFTPVDNVRLVRMNNTVMITGNMCYVYDNEQNKTPVAKVPSLPGWHNKIILGIDATYYENTKLPQRLALYCSNPAFEHVDFVFKLLPFISVSTAGNKLEVKSGLTYEEPAAVKGYEEIFKEYSMQKLIEENIKNIYKNKFIEISGLPADAITDKLPDDLTFIREQKEFSTRLQGKKMIWIEMSFPPHYTTDILESFSFTMNAFPVYNRKWKSNECTLDVMRDNIPLLTDIKEHFLYVEKVEDSYGNSYKEIPFQKDTEMYNRGLYTLRKGGMERFNERNALEMISNVLELTRDEVSAFGALERDKVIEALKDMTAQMKILEQRITNSERTAIQEINYVIINPYENISNLRATYWVTHCSLANNIRRGTTLTQPKITTVNTNQSIKLLTATEGGQEEQKGTNAVQAYKYALTTRDKLLSIEDIKNFCRLMLKNELKSVDVKRGTTISDNPKEGFIKTLEIEIVPNDYEHLGKQYWDKMSQTLKQQIILRGIDGMEYRVKIKNTADE